MKYYAYTAIAHDSKTVTGEIEAENEIEVLNYLEGKRLIPVEINAINNDSFVRKISYSSVKVRRQKKPDVLEFTRSLEMLIKSGLPLDKALVSVMEALENEDERKMIEKLQHSVREGKTFSDAIRDSGYIADEIYLQVVRAGELAGRLDLALRYLTKHLDEKKELHDSLTGMLVYPVILMIVTLFSIVILMMFVIPKFKVLFEDMQGELPLSTQLFVSVSDFVVDYGLLSGITVSMAVLIFIRLYKIDNIARYVDKNLLKVKWLGRVISDIQVARFSETVSMLMSNGMSIQKSLQTGASVITNKWLRQRSEVASERIKQGNGFYDCYGEFYPQIMKQLIRTGEQSGELASALSYTAGIIKNNVNRDMKKFITILEPVIILFLGVLVAAIISSILSAVLGMNDMIVG